METSRNPTQWTQYVHHKGRYVRATTGFFASDFGFCEFPLIFVTFYACFLGMDWLGDVEPDTPLNTPWLPLKRDLWGCTLRESDDKYEIDGEESKQIGAKHLVDHHDERSDDLEPSATIKHCFMDWVSSSRRGVGHRSWCRIMVWYVAVFHGRMKNDVLWHGGMDRWWYTVEWNGDVVCRMLRHSMPWYGIRCGMACGMK